MNRFAYLPPLLSMYLLLVSGTSTFYFKSKLNQFVERKPKLSSHKDVIEHVALDWSARLSFFNSMFTAMVSAISIFSTTKDFVASAATLLILLAIFIPMGWVIHGYEIHELSSVISKRFHLRPATWCKLILWIVNFALLIAIYYSQNYSPSQ